MFIFLFLICYLSKMIRLYFENFFKICTTLYFLFVVVAPTSDPVIISRDGWHAKPAKSSETMSTPVPYVVIHHSYEPAACEHFEDCCTAMRWMQDLHQITNGWADIGYNFAVGGDGRAYEGRGWTKVGAHAPIYNYKSIGICVIGDWTDNLPPEQQLATAQMLIEKGVREGYIQKDYKLVGHRQVRQGTECPGNRLFKEIRQWPNFSNQSHEIALRRKPANVIPVEINKNKDKDDEDNVNDSINRLEKRTVTTR